MAGLNCPLHGAKFAIPMCKHLAEAVHARRAAVAFVHQGEGLALCDTCARRRDVPEPFEAADTLVCCGCLLDWEASVKNDFSARCRAEEPEYPDGVRPADFVPPVDVVRVEGAAFVFDDGWRTVTRTGLWTQAQYPHGFWPVLKVPWPDVESRFQTEGASPFPFEAVIKSALTSSIAYWMQCAFAYIAAGFPVSASTRDLALSAVQRFPERTQVSVRQALRA